MYYASPYHDHNNNHNHHPPLIFDRLRSDEKVFSISIANSHACHMR